MFYRVQGWIYVSLVGRHSVHGSFSLTALILGMTTGFVASLIAISIDWLQDMRIGFCSVCPRTPLCVAFIIQHLQPAGCALEESARMLPGSDRGLCTVARLQPITCCDERLGGFPRELRVLYHVCRMYRSISLPPVPYRAQDDICGHRGTACEAPGTLCSGQRSGGGKNHSGRIRDQDVCCTTDAAHQNCWLGALGLLGSQSGERGAHGSYLFIIFRLCTCIFCLTLPGHRLLLWRVVCAILFQVLHERGPQEGDPLCRCRCWRFRCLWRAHWCALRRV